MGDKLSTAFDLLDSAEIYWQLGRYQEAEKALDDAIPSASRAVSELDDRIRADMALSRRDYPRAAEFSQRVLDQTGVDIDLTVTAKSTLGRAKVAAGARREGLAAMAEAALLAAKSGSAPLIADTRLANAEVLLTAGEAQRALDAARAAQLWFAGAGNQEAEWRSWLVAAGAESTLGHAGKSRESGEKAAQLLASLQQKWDAENYKTYLSRPDIQDRRNQLTKLAGFR
jgi:tetratricopeptide (TPR) repeat protein